MAQEWWSQDETVQPAKAVTTGVEIGPKPEKREAPSGYRYNAAGHLEAIPGGPADPNAPKPGDTNRIPQISTGLNAVQDLRRLSEKFLSVGKQAGNVSETPILGSLLGQNRSDLEGSIEILKGIIIQDQLARLAKINPAGISSLANTPGEQERFVSSIANLDPNQSPEQFQLGLQRAEEYLKRQMQEAGGEVPAAGQGEVVPPSLRVAEGAEFATDADFQRQRDNAEAWAKTQGLPFDQALAQFNAEMVAKGYGEAGPETISVLQWYEQNQPGNRGAVQWVLPKSGVRESEAPGRIAALGSGLLTGGTAGLAEEIVQQFDPTAAAKLEAAKQYGRENYAGTTLLGETAGAILSPLSRIGRGGTIAGEAQRGAIYGGLYGGGEAAPDAGLMERIPQAALGAVLGGATGGAAQKFLGGAVPAAAMPEGGVGGVAPEVPPIAPTGGGAAAAPAAAPATSAAAMAPEAAAELGTLVREATAGATAKAKAAQTKIAEMAQVNPEAQAAAERLGIEVPADVFSDNPQVRAAVGLTRSLAGSEAEAAWRNAVSAAVDQADNVMREFDAQFVEGAVAPGVVSQRVKDSLTNTRQTLNDEASAIYKQVDAAIPKQTPVQMDNLFRELTAIAGEVGESGLTAQEKRLMGLIQSGEAAGGDITYGRLIREKSLIGKALKREESPYGSLDEATLKRLYAALASDQMDNVGRIGGEELRSQLRGANLIYAKERALGDRIINAFGRDLEGGIASKMRSAITSAAKGDTGEFARLMKAVPNDLRKEVVATAITAAARSARGAERGGFGFSEFADLYPKLRANPPVYKQIVEALGKDASDTLRDLYQVSKRITEARANVLTTGKANQALVESLNAEGLIARIMDSSAAKRAVGAAASVGGPVTGALMPDLMAAMTKGNPDVVRAAGKMFSSPEFQAMLTEVATKPEVAQKTINRVALSPRFREFAQKIGLDPKNGKDWLRSALTTTAVAGGTEQPQGAPLAPTTAPVRQ